MLISFLFHKYYDKAPCLPVICVTIYFFFLLHTIVLFLFRANIVTEKLIFYKKDNIHNIFNTSYNC